MDFKNEVASLISKALNKPVEEISKLVEVPPQQSLGDYAFPCFGLAKELKKSPIQIAAQLATQIKTSGMIERVIATGPYVNFFLSKSSISSKVIPIILKEKSAYGSLKLKGRKALIEHTSVNPNASPHVGRARNTIIGDSLSRIMKFHGYKTEVHYFVNDIGKQIAMLVLGCGNKKLSFNDLLDEYIKINTQMEKDASVEKKVFELLKKLEDGDKKTRQDFMRVVKLCVNGQNQIFKKLGVNFDFFDYESKYLYSKDTNEVLEQLEKTSKVFVDKDNRKVLNLEGFDLAMETPVFVLTRADGTSLYGLRDLSYNLEKISRAKDRNIVVLGEDHKLYFKQVEASLSFLGKKAPEVIHYSFVLLESGKMSTRSGNVVLLEDFMKQAEDKAKEEILKRVKATEDVSKLAKSIGYGALKYHIIRVSPEKNVTFDWDQALSFEGESGPYIQYSHARICSILKKAPKKLPAKIVFSLLKEPEEAELVKLLSGFPEITQRAAEQLRPHIIANYTHLIADSFNRFYHNRRIIGEEKKLMEARLALAMSVRIVLETGLNLLGIDAPQSM